MAKLVSSRGKRIAVGLLLVAGLLAVFAAYALAAQVSLGNNVTPENPNQYHVGDTIAYVERVTNTNAVNATLTVTFTYPNAVVETLDATRVWTPSEEHFYYRNYVVTGLEAFTPTASGNRIRSYLTAQGYTLNNGGEIFGTSLKSSTVLKPGISVRKYVDFDLDGTYSDVSETNYAGQANWRVVVENTGNCPLTVTLSDTTGYGFGALALARGEIRVYEYSTTVTSDYDNTVVATGIDSLGGPAGTVTSSDSASALVLRPQIAIEKTVDFDGDGTFTEHETNWAGASATWRIKVTNTGQTPLENVTLDDSSPQVFTVPNLPVGGSYVTTYTATVNADTTNVATVSARDPRGNPAGPVSDDARVSIVTVNARLQVKKYVDFNLDGIYADAAESYYAGPANWRIVVTNTGSSALTGVIVTDTNGRTFGPYDLAPSQSATDTYAHATNVTADTNNTANATGTDVLGRPVTAPPDSAAALVLRPGVGIEKTVDFDGDGTFTEHETNWAGTPATWRIKVTNTGQTPLEGIVLDDSSPQVFTVPNLPVGGSYVTTYTTTVNADTTNVATASGRDPRNNPAGPVSDDARVSVMQANPQLQVRKYVDFNLDGTYADGSETYYAGAANWRIIVTNTGASTLTGVIATDSNGRTFGPYVLIPAQSVTVTYTTNVTADTVNTAGATGFDVLNQPVSALPDSAAAFVLRPGVGIEKTVDFDGDGTFTKYETNWAGTPATWRIKVTNTGQTPLEGIVLDDSSPQVFTVPNLPVGGSYVTTYTTMVNADTTNVATVSGRDPRNNPAGPVSDSAQVGVVQANPLLQVKKYVDFNLDDTYADGSETYYAGAANWRIIVTNTGASTLTGVIATDSNGRTFGPYVLAPAQSVTETYTTNVTADTVNTAGATGFDVLNQPVIASPDSAAALVLRPGVGIEKTVDFDGDGTFTKFETNCPGKQATWRIRVTNTGQTPLEGIVLDDSSPQVFTVPNLPVGGSYVTTYTTTVNADTTNVATVSGRDPRGNPAGPVSDSARVIVRVPQDPCSTIVIPTHVTIPGTGGVPTPLVNGVWVFDHLDWRNGPVMTGSPASGGGSGLGTGGGVGGGGCVDVFGLVDPNGHDLSGISVRGWVDGRTDVAMTLLSKSDAELWIDRAFQKGYITQVHRDELMLRVVNSGEWGLYTATRCLTYHDPAGSYDAYVKAIAGSAWREVYAAFTYLDVVAMGVDFADVTFGTVMPGAKKILAGDYDWGTPMPTIQNLGNVPLQLGFAFGTMTKPGGTSADVITLFDLEYQASSWTDSMKESWDPLAANQWVYASKAFPVCNRAKLNLSVHPPKNIQDGLYSGPFTVQFGKAY